MEDEVPDGKAVFGGVGRLDARLKVAELSGMSIFFR